MTSFPFKLNVKYTDATLARQAAANTFPIGTNMTLWTTDNYEYFSYDSRSVSSSSTIALMVFAGCGIYLFGLGSCAMISKWLHDCEQYSERNRNSNRNQQVHPVELQHVSVVTK
jgi:hypothetical protein